jgi:hypothetical protein
MNLKDIVMKGGILPAMMSGKLMAKDKPAVDPKDALIEDLKRQAAQGPQATMGQGMKKGGKVSSASSRADGCCTKGKTRGKYL